MRGDVQLVAPFGLQVTNTYNEDDARDHALSLSRLVCDAWLTVRCRATSYVSMVAYQHLFRPCCARCCPNAPSKCSLIRVCMAVILPGGFLHRRRAVTGLRFPCDRPIGCHASACTNNRAMLPVVRTYAALACFSICLLLSRPPTA